MTQPRTQVYVHGGVSGTNKALPSLAHSLADALAAATALDGVEEALRRLEDDPELNAGWGSVLNRNGVIELDAGISGWNDGTRRWGRGSECSLSDLARAAGLDVDPSCLDGG